jgi:putative membrane-bound dehydrogenase-like protein
VKRFEVLDGFRMDLLAHEPMVTSPVAIEYDENGRAYVLEMRDYPYTDKGTDKPFVERTMDRAIGRVRLLRDRDGDGVFDESSVFAEDLSWPTGIACWKGGVFVAATPDVWYFKDTDGDGKADVRVKVYTGFRKFNVQAVINNLKWGLDHHIYGAGGSNGGLIRALKDAKAAPVRLAINDFRFDPVSGRFEALSGGARFGNTFDDWGNRFIGNIRNPVQHVVLPSHYLARNPYVPVRSALNDAALAGDTLRVYRASPPEPWRVLRAERWTAEPGQTYPRSETTGEGYFTSACGVTLYRGAAYPAIYYGNAFVAEVAGDLIHRQTVTPQGVTFVARRADANTEFVRSTDNWFRPVNFVNAPDGTLHVVDMYRETIEHPWSIPDDIKAQLDLESGRDRGRIYRLTPPGFKPPKPPRLGQATTAELVACLANPNSWWRDTAHRLLHERQDRSAIDPLRTLLRQSSSPLARLHALWSLEGLGALEDGDLLRGLEDPTPGVRENAVRLAEPRLRQTGRLLKPVLALAKDPEPRVRFQAAFTLGEVDDDRATDALADIARRDASDEWIRAAVLSASANRADALLLRLAADRHFLADPSAGAWARPLALVVGARHFEPAIKRVLTNSLPDGVSADVSGAWQTEVLLGLGEGLRRAGQNLFATAERVGAGSQVKQRLADARNAVTDSTRRSEARAQAVRLLGLGDFAGVKDTLTAALDPRQPPDVRMAAIHTLSGFRDPQVAGILLGGWRTCTPSLRGEVVEALLARPERLGPLLDAVETRKVGVGEINPTRRALLMKHPNTDIRARATRLFGAGAPGRRTSVIAEYNKALSLRGDSKRGQRVFERECMACHRLAGKGHEVGPDLETIRHQPPAQLLTNVLDPNREVAPNFVEYLVTTQDGLIATGLIAAETATGITLRRAEGVQQTILRQNIEQIASTGVSLMPEGLEKKISVPEMADLIAFLLSPGPRPK